MLMRLGMVLMLFMVTACQTLPRIEGLPPLSNALTLQVSEQNNGLLQHSLLIIEPQSEQKWRFIQVDALGAPMARQILQHGKWVNDGFLPPNRQASILFSAVYAYLATVKQWPLPEALARIKVEPSHDNLGAHIEWQEKEWLVKELVNE